MSPTILKNKLINYIAWQSGPSIWMYIFYFFLFSETKSLNIIPILVKVRQNLSTQNLSENALFFSVLVRTPFVYYFPFIIFQSIFSITLSSISSPSSHPPNYLSLPFIFFLISSAFCGSVGPFLLHGFTDDFPTFLLRGFLAGSFFGFHYVFNRRYVLEFPITERPPSFNFKLGVPLAVKSAFKLSTVAFIFSAVLLEIIPHPFKCSIGTPEFFSDQIVFFIASFASLFCWELTHNIHRVIYTERSVFAPPKGSAAAETNPSEHLLSALEESNPTSLLRYLAYFDLCMVCENNVDTWRRAAFFEKSGETYKRVIAVCLRPLEQLASRLGEDLGNSSDKPKNLLNQLSSPTDVKHVEELYNIQLYVWCSRIVASLTACSRKEDKFGVARHSGSNAAVVSTLISCLLAVENFMGKKTNMQSPNWLLGSAGIKWAKAKRGRLKIAKVTGKKQIGPANSKACAIIADVLKTSIYQLVSAFHDEMLAGTKASLQRDWITSEKPLFGTREMLIQKLRLFLDFRAT